MKKYIQYLLLLCLPAGVNAQQQYTQLRFFKKGSAFEAEERDYYPGKKGFYLYENCIYTLVLRNEKQYEARVIAIKKDSILFTTYFNATNAGLYRQPLDTLAISPADIVTIRLIGDRIMALYRNVAMRKYDYEFITDTMPKRWRIDTIALYTNLPDKYELLPFLTDQGLDLLYEDNGKTYYFQGRTPKDTSLRSSAKAKDDDSVFRRKNFAWVLPTRINQINGWAIGLHTGQVYERPLTINGLNTNADVLPMFVSMMSLPHIFDKVPLGNLNDSTDKDWYITNLHGLSISLGGVGRCRNIKGIAINGGMCNAYRTRGLVVTGGFNTLIDFKGIAISTLRNISVKGRGIQVGLINVCKDLKGIQLGLWNVNGKRKLPLINWGS